MCFGMICKLKERGTAFLRRLAIQFSKTEPQLSTRKASSEPSPDRRGVAKTTGLRQGRAAYVPAPPRCVKRKTRSRRPRTASVTRELISRSTRLTRQVFLATVLLRLSDRRGAASNPSRVPPSSPWEPSTSWPLRSSWRQARFLPPPRPAVK